MAEEKKGFSFNKNILFVLAVPLLVALGVVIGSYFLNGSGQEAEAEGEEKIEEQTVLLDEFVLNLEPSGNVNRYIKLELAVSTVKEEGVEMIEDKINMIRDVIIYEVSKESIDNILEDDETKFALKDKLKEKINEALEEDLIHEVYISNMVIQ